MDERIVQPEGSMEDPDGSKDHVSKKEFIDTLCGSGACGRIVSREEACTTGVTESIDLVDEDGPIDRRSAARILHMYMKDICHIKDLADISPASCLMDLYDCRVCVNHIAQVYLRGLIKASDCPDVCIFDGLKPLDRKDMDHAIDALCDLINAGIN